MKGHATIELTDVNTKETQKIEEDNMVTNAIKYFCTGAGRMASPYFPSDPLYEEMLGGIFLWDEQLEENVENVLPPATAGVTGIGCSDVANSGTATHKLGSYNSSESSVLEDGSVKMVWDFATNQANGEIACLTLTSRNGALAGYDYDEPGKYYTAIEPFSGGGASEFGINNIKPIKLDLENDLFYKLGNYSTNFTANHEEEYCTYTGKLRIYQYELGIKKYSINRLSSITDVYSYIEIDLPTELMDVYSQKNANITYNVSDENIYLIFAFLDDGGYISKNGTFHILKLSKNFDSVAVYEMKNSFPFKLGPGWAWISDSGFLYVQLSYKHYSMDLNDYTNINSIDSSRASIYYRYEIKGRIHSDTNSDSNYGKSLCLNTSKFKEEYTNNSYAYNNSNKYNYFLYDNKNQLFQLRNFSNNYRLTRNWGYLATINNLATPVTKTASQTMKVTYTLTFDDETKTQAAT